MSFVGLRCGTLVSADSTGSVQFWDSQHGTLLQAYSFHKGDVNALAAAPGHSRVFSAGSDGQVRDVICFLNCLCYSTSMILSLLFSRWSTNKCSCATACCFCGIHLQ